MIDVKTGKGIHPRGTEEDEALFQIAGVIKLGADKLIADERAKAESKGDSKLAPGS